jgi:hypothetical protein
MATELISPLALDHEISVSRNQNGYSAVGVYKVSGLNAQPADKRAFLAVEWVGIPQYGAPFATTGPGANTGMTVTNKTARMIDGDVAEVQVTWGNPEVNVFPGEEPDFSIGTTVAEVESNYAGNGDPIFTNHNDGLRVGTVASGEAVSVFKYSHIHLGSPESFGSRTYVNTVNDANLFSEENSKGCWRCSEIQGTKLPGFGNYWRIDYTFHYRKPKSVVVKLPDERILLEGWQAIIVETDPATGQPYPMAEWKYSPPDEFTAARVQVYEYSTFTDLPIGVF